MRILLVTGFLGSGKTTFMIKLAQQAATGKEKVAILVNEIGEIGIDNQLMRQLDLNVWEITGGCICCTLLGELLPALEKLERDYHPDLVMMEPSGAADPSIILKLMDEDHAIKPESIFTVSIFDPIRAEMLYSVLSPLIESQLGMADMVILSKSDLASDEEIKTAKKIVEECNPQAEIVTANLHEAESAFLIKVLACLK